jgi:ABC-type transport system substrate-binding protein
VGTGPYKWVSYNPVTQSITLAKFDDYWNKAELEAQGLFQAQQYRIKFIADKTAALASLKNKEVDMLDPNYQMQVDIPTIDASWGKVLLQDGTGRQEIGYNIRHPIFGTGVDTPLGKANASRAAEAARYVRTAFDYAIPRQLIIDNLLSGYGQPGATPMLPTQPFYNSSITPREYNLALAREYLEKAGYTVPTPAPPAIPPLVLGGSTIISGVYTDADGNPIPNEELELRVTNDNASYQSASAAIGKTTTDLNGFYSFTVTPTNTGGWYYYLFDSKASAENEWRYVTTITVTSMQDALMPIYYLIVATLVITIVIGAITIYVTRSMLKKKS